MLSVWCLVLLSACGGEPQAAATPLAQLSTPVDAGDQELWYAGALPADGDPLAYALPSWPQVTLFRHETWIEQGELDTLSVERGLDRVRNQIRYCHQREDPGHALRGTMTVTWEISEVRTTTSASVTPSEPALQAVAACLQTRVERVHWQWAESPGRAGALYLLDPGLPFPLRGSGGPHAYGQLDPLVVTGGQVDVAGAEAMIADWHGGLRLCAHTRFGEPGTLPPPPAGHMTLRLALGDAEARFNTRVWVVEDTLEDEGLLRCLAGRSRQLKWAEHHTGPAEVLLTMRYSPEVPPVVSDLAP